MGDHPQSQDDKPKKGGDGQKPPATPQGPGESTAETNGTFGSGVKKGITAHVQYSSSVGVVGCELADGALERVAFFPGQPSCDNWCVKITNDNNGKSDYFLRIDGSTGAYDISCKGYDFLLDRENPKGCETAGHEEWTVADAEPENCRRFLKDGLMPTMTVNWPAECANSKTFGKGGPFRIKQLEGYQDQRCIGTSKEIKDPAYHAETLR
ncbi:hypothetical protein CDD83_9117 [Cordyceps sp. RAO-2017]|nr:hypothetical protein CDD83_9117 [Cordyceps sp. RAO-2017]